MWTLFIVLLLLTEIYSQENQQILGWECDFLPSCKCKQHTLTNLFIVDCSNLNLTNIPQFPDVIQELDLQQNNIAVLKNGIFRNKSRLKTLNLSHNKIRVLLKSSFEGLDNLLSLQISNNDLSRGKEAFENGCFAHFKQLKHLDLKGNSANSFQPDLSSLSFLESLGMDFITEKVGIFGIQFSRLRLLKNLDLSGFTGRCFVTMLTPESFQYLSQVEKLDLSECKINFILKGTFKEMKNISHLDISNNTCLKFQGLENVTYDLQRSAIKILKFNKIHNAFELNTILRISHIQHLQNTSLQELHCDSNRVQIIEKGALKYLPKSLQFVSMKGNEFSYGPYLFDLFGISLQRVDLSFSFSFHNPKEIFEKCFSRPTYPTNDYYITRHEPFSVFERQNELFRSSLVKSWHKNVPKGIWKTNIPVPYNLTKAWYRGCGMKYSLAGVRFSNNKMEYLDLSNNAFYSWKGPISNLKHLKYLDLSNNLCSYVSSSFFTPDFNNVKVLNMKNNMLGVVLKNDVNGDILRHLNGLEEVNLSQNRIPGLQKDFFKAQQNLEIIDLSNNMLEALNFQITHMFNLKYLNLRNNRFTVLDESARQQLNSLSKDHANISVDLRGNTLDCSCNHLDFIKWIAFTDVRLIKVQHYQCLLTNQKKQRLGNLRNFYNAMRKECTSYNALIFGLAGTIFIFLIIVSGGLVYRYRWKLRYLYYMVKIRSHGRKENWVGEESKPYMYGAFISYADEDRHFVHTTLLHKLEKESGIELCLHKRNFLPGNDIATNITSAIHNSRKTVVIMSHNYLNSYWCMFEFNMAKMESIYERGNENVLFLVFYEQMTARELPLHVLELVQSQSYIEYPNDEYGDAVFWDQLRKVLTP